MYLPCHIAIRLTFLIYYLPLIWYWSVISIWNIESGCHYRRGIWQHTNGYDYTGGWSDRASAVQPWESKGVAQNSAERYEEACERAQEFDVSGSLVMSIIARCNSTNVGIPKMN